MPTSRRRSSVSRVLLFIRVVNRQGNRYIRALSNLAKNGVESVDEKLFSSRPAVVTVWICNEFFRFWCEHSSNGLAMDAAQRSAQPDIEKIR